MTKRFLIAALCACSTNLAGCGKNETSNPAPAPAQAPAAVQEAVKSAPTAPLPLTAASVDTCALIARADVEAVVGPLAQDPKADTPAGSLLGQCSYYGADASLILSARPAREFDGTVKYAGEKAAVQPVAGLGEKASQTQYGLMIQPAGKAYFLTVVVMRPGGALDGALSVDIARKLKL